MPKLVDLTGQRFGKLVVQERLQSRRDGSVLWKCVCDCGNYAQVNTRHLNRKKSNVRSCGCGRNPSGPSHTQWNGVGGISGSWWSSRVTREFRQKSRAKIEVSIDKEFAWDLFRKQEGKCALTGLPLVLDSKPSVNTASLDRIDSNLGYVPSNVQWVHKDINMMKRTYDQDYFIKLCKLVASGACPIR